MRPEWDAVWMSVAKTISQRSIDPRHQVGAIIVSDDNTQLLALGYNGNYKGGPNRTESDEPGMSGLIHAEQNALIKLDYNNLTFDAVIDSEAVTHNSFENSLKIYREVSRVLKPKGKLFSRTFATGSWGENSGKKIKENEWVLKKNNNCYPIDIDNFKINGFANLKLDCIFNAIHGTPGEDGKIQKYFNDKNIPITGCNSYQS